MRQFLIALAFLVLALPAWAQDCTRYLNATDGDDANAGGSPSQAVQSFEHAFEQFPDESVVCMFAGEYIFGSDADGIQLTSADARDKNLTFLIRAFGGRQDVRFSEDSFVIDLRSGSLAFVSENQERIVLGLGVTNSPSDFADNYGFLHSLVLRSGLLDVRSSQMVLERSVGNPAFSIEDGGVVSNAPETAAILRDEGEILGTVVFEGSMRTVRYVGSQDRTSGPELPTEILDGALDFALSGASITIDDDIIMAGESTVTLQDGGNATFLTRPTLRSGPHVVNMGSGLLEFAAGLAIEISDIGGIALDNEGEGVLDLGRVSVQAAPNGTPASPATVRNLSTGHVRLEDLAHASIDSSATTRIINETNGLLTLGQADAVATVEAVLANLGRVNILNDIVMGGEIDNDGTVDLSTFTLTLSGDSRFDNRGVILADSVSANPSEPIVLRGTVALGGTAAFPGVAMAEGNGRIERGAVVDALHVSGGSTMTIGGAEEDGQQDSTVNVLNDVVVGDGTLAVVEGLSVGEDLIQDPGSRLIVDALLCIRQDYTRTGGSMEGGGTLCFDGETNQAFNPGEDLLIPALQVSGAETSVALSSPISVSGDVLIEAASRLELGGHDVRLIGDGAQLVVSGAFDADPEGEIVFADPNPGTAPQTIRGSGTFGNVRIELDAPADAVEILSTTLALSGTLTCAVGGIDLGGANFVLSPSQRFPMVRVALPSTPPEGCFVTDGGKFNSSNQLYDLEYFGPMESDHETGTEFISRMVRNLSISTEGDGSVVLAAEKGIFGSLHVDATAVLDLNGEALLSLGNNAHHIIDGEIRGGSFSLAARNGTLTSNVRSGRVEHLVIDDGADARLMGQGYVRTLDMLGDALILDVSSPDSAGSIGRFHQNAGIATLASPLTVDTFLALDGGRLDLDGNNINLVGEASLRVIPGHDESPRVDPGTSDFTSGFVVFAGSEHEITDSLSLPRVRIAGASVSLQNGLMVTDIIDLRSGSIDLNGSDFDLGDATWQWSGGRLLNGGRISASGNSAIQLRQDVVLPTLYVSDDAHLRISTQPGEPHSITIEETLTLAGGTLNLSKNDIVLQGADSTLVYQGGTISSSGGELVFAGEADQSIAALNALEIPYVRLEGNVTFDGAADLTISSRIAIGKNAGTLQFSDPSADLVLKAGATIVRTGPGDFQKTPIFPENGIINVSYEAPVASGREIPANGLIHTLTLDVEEGDVELNRQVTISSRLHLDSGNIETTTTHRLLIAEGATVTRTHGSVNQSGDGSNLVGGPYILAYSNTDEPIFTSDGEFPSSAQISTLRVEGAARTSLHESRTVDSLVVSKTSTEAAFDLNAETLRTRGGVRVRRGTVTSHVGAGTLLSGGPLDVDAEGSIANAEGLPAPGIVNVVVSGPSVVDGSFLGSDFVLKDDLAVSGAIGPFAHLRFERDARIFTFNAADSDRSSVDLDVDQITIELSDSTAALEFESASTTPFKVSAQRLDLAGGILNMGPHEIAVPCSSEALSRPDAETPSHVYGWIGRRFGSDPACDEAGVVFPTGSDYPDAAYRPVEWYLADAATVPAGTTVRMRYVDAAPGGIAGGVSGDGGESERSGSPPFHWLLDSNPSLGDLQLDRLVLRAGKLDVDQTDVPQIRVFSRGSSLSDPWMLVGTESDYDVVVNDSSDVTITVSNVRLDPGGDASVLALSIPNMPGNSYPSVQVVNNMSGLESIGIRVGDDTLATALHEGGATPFLNISPGPAEFVFFDDAGNASLTQVVELDTAATYILIAEGGVDDPGVSILSEAVAGGDVDAESALVAFYHGAPNVGPVTILDRYEGVALFEHLLYGEFSDMYVGISPSMFATNIAHAGAPSDVLYYSRIDLASHAGHAFLAVLRQDAGGAIQLDYVRDDGQVFRPIEDVAAEDELELPSRFTALGNSPNPVSAKTRIHFELPESAEITVELFDVLGRRVHTFPPQRVAGGSARSVEIDASSMASGHYVYRIIAVGAERRMVDSGQMIVVR